MARSREPTIIHLDTETIRAKLGIDELYDKPTLTISASYAVPKASTSHGEASGGNGENDSKESWVVGERLEKEQGEAGFEGKWEVRWPFRPAEPGHADDWEGREYILKHVLTTLGVPIASNSSPLILVPPPSASFPLSTQSLYSQLAFEKLNVPTFALLPPSLAAIFALGQTTGVIVHIGRSRTIVNVIIDSILREECSTTVPLGTQHCEEDFIELLMADAALDRELRIALGTPGPSTATATPSAAPAAAPAAPAVAPAAVAPAAPAVPAAEPTEDGAAASTEGQDAVVPKESWEEGEKEKYVKELAEFVWKECTLGEDLEIVNATGAKSVIPGTEGEEDSSFDVAKKLVGEAAPAAIPSHKSKKQLAALAQKAATAAAQAQASAEAALAADVIVCKIPSIPDKTIDLGPVRHRIVETLFKGRGGESVWEAIGRAVEHPSVGWDVRQSVWDGVGVVGDVARIRSLGPALTTYLSPFLVSSAELSEVQPSKLRLLSIPDYFANYKGSTTELAPFLGATISAKTLLADAGLSISKIQYNALGPAAIYTSKDEAK